MDYILLLLILVSQVFPFFFFFPVLIEQVPFDLENPYENSGCWALNTIPWWMTCVKLQN